jgi:hypothetical protein
MLVQAVLQIMFGSNCGLVPSYYLRVATGLGAVEITHVAGHAFLGFLEDTLQLNDSFTVGHAAFVSTYRGRKGARQRPA